MKGSVFCASQASTAICRSMQDQIITPGSSSSSSTIYLGGSSSSRAIDRHNPIIRDARRITKINPPCSFQTPINPKPQKPQKHNKSSNQKKRLFEKQSDQKKKSSVSSVSTKTSDLITYTPPGSTRYLLGGNGHKNANPSFEIFPDFDPVLALVPAAADDNGESKKKTIIDHDVKIDQPSSSSSSKPSSSSSSFRSPDQVVVLRVSLHCRGCEGKVRKHISRMPGVKSFNIDFAAKKVTVTGDVTPVGVLASISKVKTAQLWTPAMSASSVGPNHIPSKANSKK